MHPGRQAAGKPTGKAQTAIMGYLGKSTGPAVVTDMSAHPSFRGIHFAQIESAVAALVKKGLVKSLGSDGDSIQKVARGRYLAIRELPDVIQRALGEVSYRRRDIEVKPATSYQMAGSSGAGKKSFVIAVNMASGQYKVEWGSWGGANAFSPTNPVDLDTKSRPIPANGAVISGTTGGNQPTWAYIQVPPGNMQALLPEEDADMDLTDGEKAALYAIGHYKSFYRKEQFQQWGLGPYGPRNPHVTKLLALGLAKTRGQGLMITTKGRNVDLREPSYNFKVAFKTVHPTYEAARALYDEIPMTIARTVRTVGKPNSLTHLEMDLPWGALLAVYPDTSGGKFGFFVGGEKVIDTDIKDPKYAARMLVSILRRGPKKRGAAEIRQAGILQDARRFFLDPDPDPGTIAGMSEYAVKIFRPYFSQQGWGRKEQEQLLLEELTRIRQAGLKADSDGFEGYIRLSRAGSPFRLNRKVKAAIFLHLATHRLTRPTLTRSARDMSVDRQAFERAAAGFLRWLQNKMDREDEDPAGTPQMSYMKGRRYWRIVKERQLPNGQSAFGFLDTTNGDILKAESWRKPAMHARGNVLDESTWARAVPDIHGMTGLQRGRRAQALDTLAKRARTEPAVRAKLVPLLRKARTAAQAQKD